MCLHYFMRAQLAGSFRTRSRSLWRAVQFCLRTRIFTALSTSCCPRGPAADSIVTLVCCERSQILTIRPLFDGLPVGVSPMPTLSRARLCLAFPCQHRNLLSLCRSTTPRLLNRRVGACVYWTSVGRRQYRWRPQASRHWVRRGAYSLL